MILICVNLTLIQRLFLTKLRNYFTNLLQGSLRLLTTIAVCVNLIFSAIYHVSGIAQIVRDIRSVVRVKRSWICFRSHSTGINLLNKSDSTLTHVTSTGWIVADLTRWWHVPPMPGACIAQHSEMAGILINGIWIIHSIQLLSVKPWWTILSW